MRKQFILPLLFSISFVFGNIFFIKSQTNEEEHLRKYWNYRDRFHKQFVRIGSQHGNGINISNINNDPSQANTPAWDHTNGLDGLPGAAHLHGYREWGDAMNQQGDYITVLATEYKLLKDAGKDYQGTLNELYYAIEAVRRLDEYAERYYQPGHAIDFNGFFIRDDVPQDMASDWTGQFANTEDPKDAYEGVPRWA